MLSTRSDAKNDLNHRTQLEGLSSHPPTGQYMFRKHLCVLGGAHCDRLGMHCTEAQATPLGLAAIVCHKCDSGRPFCSVFGTNQISSGDKDILASIQIGRGLVIKIVPKRCRRRVGPVRSFTSPARWCCVSAAAASLAATRRHCCWVSCAAQLRWRMLTGPACMRKWKWRPLNTRPSSS